MTGAVAKRRHLPVFWIDGRSGDGKSVLLLQLAESILRSRPDVLIYQASRPDRVPDLIDHAAGSEGSEGLILLVVDNLHRITDQDAFSTALKLALDRDSLNIGVLACGPTPEKDAFVRANPLVECLAWSMPALSGADLSIFNDWFATNIATNSALERTILVEALVVSTVGRPLPAFAESFGQRLKAFGVLDLAQKIVAINALDVGAPSALFESPTEQDSIERLAREDQLHFEWKTESWGRGVWLVHGAIAWRLFDEWSSDELRKSSLATRLVRVLSTILRTSGLPNTFGLQLMLGLRQRMGVLLGLLEATDGHRMSLLNDLLNATEDHSFARCFPMIAITNEWLLDHRVAIEPRLVLAAQNIADDVKAPAASRLTIATHLALLESAKRIPMSEQRVRAEALVLDRAVGVEGEGAVNVLVSHAGSAPQLMSEWLEVHGDAIMSAGFVHQALQRVGGTPPVVAAALRWIKANSRKRQASDLLAQLLQQNRDEGTINYALTWINDSKVVAGKGEVLTVLVRRTRDEEVRRVATEWVDNHKNNPRALEVMSTLLRVHSSAHRAAIMPLAIALIREHWAHPQVGTLIGTALSKFDRDYDLASLTSQWLQHHRADLISGDVISALLKQNRNDAHATTIALDWISSVGVSPRVSHVLSSLLNTQGNQPAIIAAALGWVRTNPESKAIGGTISTLLKVAGDSGDVKDAALEWTSGHMEVDGVSHVISSLLHIDDNRAAQELGQRWASEHLSDVRAGQLLSALAKAAPLDLTIRKLAIQWLDIHDAASVASQVISTLLFVTNGHADVQARAEAWAVKNSHRRAEQHQLIASLIGTAVDKQKWIDLALSLVGPPRPQVEEPYLFEALCAWAPLHPNLQGVVISYLENPRNGVNQRQLVLESWIVGGGPQGPALRELATLDRNRDREGHDGMQLFGIMARAVAHTWEVSIRAAALDQSIAPFLCYLVGSGCRSISFDSEGFIAAIGEWPTDHVSYVWKGLIESSVEARRFIDPLNEWLRSNRHLRSYYVVLEAVGERMRLDAEFASRVDSVARSDEKVMRGRRAGRAVPGKDRRRRVD